MKGEGWEQLLREKENEKTDIFMKKNQCPECSRKHLYYPPKLEELRTSPAKGNGYISIRGCPECHRVFYIIVEDD